MLTPTARANPAPTPPNRDWRNPAPATAAGPPSNSAGERSIPTPIESLDPGEALVYWFLHNRNAITSADASRLPELKDCFQIRHGILVTNKYCSLEMPDPWGVRPIQSFVELLCTDRQLVLLRLSSTDICFDTCFFVYGFPFSEGEHATIVKLPQIAYELSGSFGIVRHIFNSEQFVVVNLERKYNPVIKRVEVVLNRLWYSGKSWQSKLNAEVKLKRLSGTCISRKWRTDKVFTFMGALLYVDLSQGVILRCNNPLQHSEASFDFIDLPRMEQVRRPQTYSVGCCNNELKLVKILDTSDVYTVNVSIMTFNKNSYKRKAGAYWDSTCTISLELWSAMKDMRTFQHLPSDLKALENYIVCYPVLSSCREILYLTMAAKDHTSAWLLQVDTKLRLLVGAADYSGFSKHRQPPYSSNFEVNTESYPGFS